MSPEPASMSQSGSELARFFDLALDLLVVAGLDGYLKLVNPAYERTLGYPLQELLARPMLDVVHPDDVERVQKVLGGLLQGEDVIAFENRVVCADGSVRWLQWNTRAMPERGIVYGVGRDVTDQKRADAELRDTQRMLEAGRDELRVLADEQAALRRVATLVARGVAPADVFPAVAAEVSVLFGSEVSAIVRFEEDGTATVLGDVGGPHKAGERVTLDPGYVVDVVRETSRSARFDTDDPSAVGDLSLVRSLGVRSAVASPIVVEGELWGAITAASLEGPLAPAAEQRLREFTELVATAVANTQAREELTTLAEEQAALRRVATLVAQGVPAPDVFSAVSDEVARLFGTTMAAVGRFDPEAPAIVIVGASARTRARIAIGSRYELDDAMVATQVYRTGRSARVGPAHTKSAAPPVAEFLRRINRVSSVASPIVVDGRLWGVITVTSESELLPPLTQVRMEKFTELVATAIANAEAREQVALHAEEQAARRRVAELVAREAPQAEVFSAIAAEIGRLSGSPEIRMIRFEDDEAALVVAGSGERLDTFPVGLRVPLGGDNATSRVFQTGEAVRIDDYRQAGGPIADAVRTSGPRSVVATPIVVDGRPWGAMLVAAFGEEPVPPDTEGRLAQFTELMATAIGNADARAEIERLADEQAALRRVATLVAEDPESEELFSAVAREVAGVMDVRGVIVERFEADGTGLILGSAYDHELAGADAFLSVGVRLPLSRGSCAAQILETHRPARVESYSNREGTVGDASRAVGIGSGCAAPIIVDGRLWGQMCVYSREDLVLPAGTEYQLEDFVQLVATAIANYDARATMRMLADEQAALRRVATLVAKGARPEEVFAAVAEETASTMRAATTVLRFDHDPPGVVLVGASTEPLGERWAIDDVVGAAKVYRTGRSARASGAEWLAQGGPLGEALGRLGIVSTVASPIVVEGSLWGVIAVLAQEELSPDTEQRLEKFTELLATAIANVDARSELTASRARIAAAADDERRRVVRDLHDGAQQRLVHTLITLKMAQQALGDGAENVPILVREAIEQAEQAIAEVRELAHGILPAALTHGGLRAGLDALLERIDLPLQVDLPSARLPAEIEASAYFIVAEALTNMMKHSHASHAEVSATVEDGVLQLDVRDNGIGGADRGGHGLTGMADRVSALGGKLTIESTAGAGTHVSARLPCQAPEPPPRH